MDLNATPTHTAPAAGSAASGALQAPPLRTRWARHLDDLRAAQRLRHRVFTTEYGAQVPGLHSTPAGHDEDRFDQHCEHLLVCAGHGQDEPERVVGTYRLLPPWQAAAAGGLYTDEEFDLSALDGRRSGLLELGRSCVDPDWRGGAVVLALWAALGQFMQQHRLQTMVGCASVGMRDGGHCAASLWTALQAQHLAPAPWQVRPRLPLPVAQLECHHVVSAPPLIKGYLRCGARLMGPPAWDPHFNTADLPLVMHLPDLPPRYRRHFLGQA